jgi:hypothetical protein
MTPGVAAAIVEDLVMTTEKQGAAMGELLGELDLVENSIYWLTLTTEQRALAAAAADESARRALVRKFILEDELS